MRKSISKRKPHEVRARGVFYSVKIRPFNDGILHKNETFIYSDFELAYNES